MVRPVSPLNKCADLHRGTRSIDDYRQHFESDKQWSARRQFILKNIEEYEGYAVDKLLALSMVWVNHVFLGCRYGSQLMQKVLEMAEGIDVGEMSSYQLVLNAEAKKRPLSYDGSDEPKRKMLVSTFSSRPRFEPVHFVSGGSSGSGPGENDRVYRRDVIDVREWEPDHQPCNGSHGNGSSSTSGSHLDSRWSAHDSWPDHRSKDMTSGSTSGLGYNSKWASRSVKASVSGVQQEYTTKYEAPNIRQSDSFSKADQSDRFRDAGWSGVSDGGRRGLGFEHQDRPTSSKAGTSGSTGLLPTPSLSTSIPTTTIYEKQRLITRVSTTIAVAIRDPTFISGPDTPNYNFILSRSIQACRTNPEYIYVNLRDIPPADLPKKRKVPSEGYACELRCQNVYLATGYSGSKNGARDRASEQAVRLLLKSVEIRVLQRLYKRAYLNDMVVCEVNALNPNLPPPLRNPEAKPPPSSKRQYEPNQSKHWTEFVIMENAHDSICILNNSAAFNRMKVEYTFEMIPNGNLCVCSVYIQGELMGQARGTKKSSKHLAAEKTVNMLRMYQATRQQDLKQNVHGENPSSNHPRGVNLQLGELVILENSDNAICIINDTAQFNKVLADYKFTVLPDHRWRCEVYLNGQYVAEGVGPKKTVKHIAAEEALATLRLTQAVVKSNLRKENDMDAISRNQIMSHSGEEAMRQEIKEDNIGNQLLRKMGWTGGGLGREGEGIAEPIRVKEQFTRQGLGMDKRDNKLIKSDIEAIIRTYASSDRQDDLRFSTELTNEERRQIHQVSQKYGLRSKSYGQGQQRFLVVSHKVQKEQLIGQLLQEGQVGRYELVKPQAFP